MNYQNLYTEKELDDYPITCSDAPHRDYAFTLRKTKSPDKADKSDYTNHLCKLISKGAVVKTSVFEHTEGLHMHGVIRLPSGYNIVYLRFRGWRLHLVEIYDPNGWRRYCLKEQHYLINAFNEHLFHKQVSVNDKAFAQSPGEDVKSVGEEGSRRTGIGISSQ